MCGNPDHEQHVREQGVCRWCGAVRREDDQNSVPTENLGRLFD